MSPKHQLYKSDNFLAVCASKGLTTAKLTSTQDFKSLVMLSFEQYYPFHQNQGIIVGYDFSCNTYKGCTGQYYSLDGSTPLNPTATAFNKILGKNFTPIIGNEVLMLISGHLKTVSVSSAKVVGVACQSIDEFEVRPLTCSNTLRDLDPLG